MKTGLFTDMHQGEYRAIPALANSDAVMIEKNPADYIWSRNAPTNFAKVMAKDIGTALHALLLEPETYEDLIHVSSIKGRQTKTFEQEIIDNPDKIALTQEEAEQVQIMAGSVAAHPSASYWLGMEGNTESSIIINDAETGAPLKCRPDKDIFQKTGYLIDVKKTADLEKWRSTQEWINPLHALNYGHNASFYTDIAEQFYQREALGYIFICIQSTVALGKYPVGVFILTKEQMIEQGFWARHRVNIETYKNCVETNNWIHSEGFDFPPKEFGYDDDVEVTFEGDE